MILLKKVFPLGKPGDEIPLFGKVSSALAQQFMARHLGRRKLLVVTHVSLKGRETREKGRQPDATEESG